VIEILIEIMIPDFQASDCYKVLGCPRGSDPQALKRAYRKLAMKWHPDKNPHNEEATKIFQKISEAYIILTDESKNDMKENRDTKRHMPRQEQEMAFQDIKNLFDSIFRNATRSSPTNVRFETPLDGSLPRGTRVYFVGDVGYPRQPGTILSYDPSQDMYLVHFPSRILNVYPVNLCLS